jgi:uncharacterized protein (UPF0261 family)
MCRCDGTGGRDHTHEAAIEGRIDGVISLGGGGGTSICTTAMRALPLGFPKLMVSTLASGNTAHMWGEGYCDDAVDRRRRRP